MSETKMLGIACFAMLALSVVSAFILMFVGAGPLVTIIGGTLVGMAVYVAICLLSKPYVIAVPDLAMEEAMKAITEQLHNHT